MACGAAGNAIQFIQRFDGISFRHAYELLDNGGPQSEVRREVYLKDYRDLVELEDGVSRWMSAYNHQRTHQALDYRCPWALYRRPSQLAEVA